MEIKGYKAFDINRMNRYGMPFEEGKTYRISGPIKFGNDGNGFHLCTELCDVFRYFDPLGIQVAEVTGRGRYEKFDDEYYGYYDMYAVEEITINRFLTREEIIAKILNTHEFNVKKFLNFFLLTDEEKLLFARKFGSNLRVMEWLLYYQYGALDIYKMNHTDKEAEIRKVLTYGQDNNKRSKGEQFTKC